MRHYGNGMKEDVTRCITEVRFGSLSRQCLRRGRWRVDGGQIGPPLARHLDKLYCGYHARQLARQHEGEW